MRDGVSDHHERWDGGGYPNGVAGDDISHAGRIVAVADAFDVMTSARSYKEPMSIDAARRELVAQAGRQFDPDVVRAFLAISVRRLRVLIGPMVGFVALFGGRRMPVVRPVVRHAAGSVAVAAALTLGVLGTGGAGNGNGDGLRGGPTAPAESQTRPESATGETPPEVLGDSVTSGDDTPLVERPALGGAADAASPSHSDDGAPDVSSPDRGAQGPNTATPVDTAAATDGDTDVPDGEPESGGGVRDGDRADEDDEPGPAPERVSIVIDPEAGSVTVDGVGPAEGIELVDVPATGGPTCDGVGICDPIVVETPIPAPRTMTRVAAA